MNRVYEEDAISYNEQLALGSREGTVIEECEFSIPKGVEYLDNKTVVLRFYAPNAKSVTAQIEERQVELKMNKNGVWEGRYTCETPGYKALFWEVDGNAVLNPMASVGFGWSKPINYVDFPEEDVDFYQMKDVPHGTIAQEFYFSSVTGQYESCMLYLPPEYMGNSDRNYPVLYLQHGHGENEKCWIYQGKVNFIMDNLIAEKKAEPCIIVMNNGMVHTKDSDNHPIMDSGLLETLLIEDCIPFIERKYRVKTGKENRAMAGLSMGSMQTSITTLSHPDLFAYVGVFSGFMSKIMDGNVENEHLKLLNDREKFMESFKVFMRAMGTEDRFFSVFEKDNELMEEKGLMPEECSIHKIFYYPGEHEWQVWRKCARDYLMLIFK